MMVVYFAYGLAFFSLGLAVLLEMRHSSDLPLGKQLGWLAAFGFAHSAVEWIDMLILIGLDVTLHETLLIVRTVLLPVSAILLVRFGIGLVNAAGPLPDWLTWLPLVLLTPIALLIAYAIVVIGTQSALETATDVWSRYLLYFPGNLLAAFGFMRQARSLPSPRLVTAKRLLWGATLAFLFNSIVAGLIVPEAPYGFAPWLNYANVLAITGVPVQIWRTLSALAVTLFVMRALGIFEAERKQTVKRLQIEREQVQQEMLVAQAQARRTAENWIAALVEINQQIAALNNVDAILIKIVQRARELLQADSAALGLWNTDRSQLLTKAYATTDRVESALSIPVKNGWITSMARDRTKVCTQISQHDMIDLWNCPVLNAPVQSAAIVSLCMNDEPLGAIWVTHLIDRSFNEVETLGLSQLADQAVIAIEHALMAERLQSLAVIEERGRIAREMHDGLAQILGYLSLETQTLEALVRQGDLVDVMSELASARQRINDAQADVRDNILSLRTTLADDLSLLSGLHEYVAEFGRQTGIEVQMINDVTDLSHLSPMSAAQLIRIIQEALANIRKHSAARQAQIRLATHDHRLCMTITDDGQGFVETPRSGHFGLQTMRERAASAGGGLTITSRPHAGTQIDLWLPLVSQQN